MRPLRDIAEDIADLAPDGGDTWQNTGVKAVPVRLLTELREAVERERRVKVAWQAAETCNFCGGLYEKVKTHEMSCTSSYAGAWRFEG